MSDIAQTERLEDRTLMAADFVVASANGPSAAMVNDTISISYTVTNQGDVAATPGWVDYFYISDSASASDNATFIAQQDNASLAPLAAGASYTVNRTLAIPDTAAGSRFLVILTNPEPFVTTPTFFGPGPEEVNFGNNLRAIPISLTRPNVEVDLIVTTASAPASGIANDSVNLSWTVQNTGTVASAAVNWRDEIYLSSTPNLGEGSNYKLLDFVEHPTSVVAGATYTVDFSTTLANFPVGSRYLVIKTDADSRQLETNNGNNLIAVPITIVAPNVDLTVSSATAPTTANLGDSVTISWTVTNTGSESAKAFLWNDRVYVSNDQKLSNDDQELTSEFQFNFSGLAGIASYTTTQTVTVPVSAAGGKFLLFKTDDSGVIGFNDEGDQGEINENNNIRVLPFELPGSDLIVTAASGPASAIFGEPISISYTIQNQGNYQTSNLYSFRVSYDALYLSTDNVFDENDVLVNFTNSGSTPVAANGTYTANKTFTLPSFIGGSQFLLVVADAGQDVREKNETNNVHAIPITLSGPDLTITDATAPTAAVLGDTISVSYTVANQGATATPADTAWFDYAYLSIDAQLDANDVSIGSFHQRGQLDQSPITPLAAGASYTATRPITLSGNVSPGNLFLLLATDKSNLYGTSIAETDKSNNVIAKAITLTAPDLTVSNLTAPNGTNANSQIEVSWTVQNIGNVVAPADWSDSLYLSNDMLLDDDDVFINSELISTQTPLAAQATYTLTRNVTIGNVSPGAKFLLLKTDSSFGNQQPETDETNNVRAVPINIVSVATNLAFTASSAPSSAILGDEITVQWTVANQGTDAAESDWFDTIYLSTDNILSEDDMTLSSISAGSHSPLIGNMSYMVSESVRLSQGTAGERFLLIKTDRDNDQAETNEADNVVALPISLSAPDLIVTNLTAPATTIDNRTISVSYTVKNQGSVAAPADWYDRLFLSNDTVFDLSDTALDSSFISSQSPLAPDGTYTITGDVYIPDTTLGDRYLLLVTDFFEDQPETNESNNQLTMLITLIDENADLVPTAFTGPSSALAGQTIDVSWTVKNNGALDAAADGFDAIYLSNDEILDVNDQLLDSFSNFSLTPLNAGASYTQNKSLNLSASNAGNKYLLIVVDQINDQLEINEINNVRSLPITVQSVDLVVTTATAPTTFVSGDSVSVSFTVANQGNASALTDWHDFVYLSADNIFSPFTDQLIGSVSADSQSPLGAGANYSQTQNLNVVTGFVGNGFLIFVADELGNGSGIQPETNNGNNTFSVPVRVLSIDLGVDAGSVSAPSAAQYGQTINVAWRVRNAGEDPTLASWSDGVYLSSDGTLDGNDRLITTVPAAGPLPLNANGTYTLNATVTLPLDALASPGNFFLIVKADVNNGQHETIENNNFTASTPINLTFPPLPNLQVTDVVAPTAGFTSQFFNVEWTVHNNGGARANNSWKDEVLLSTDAIEGNSDDVLLGTFPYVEGLDVGQSVTRTQRVRFPSTPDTYHIFVRTDVDNAVFEALNEGDNITFRESTINVENAPLPDLVVTNVTAPPDGVLSNTTVRLTYTITNQGTAPTQAPSWGDYVLLSRDPGITWSGYDSLAGLDDQLINNQPFRAFSVTNASYLEPGQSYTQTVDVRLPVGSLGPFYLYVISDGIGSHFSPRPAVTELNEANNLLRSAAFNVSLTPPPDLQVTDAQAPSQAFSGQNATLSWTVTNNGAGPTANAFWSDAVYLSTDNVLDETDQLLLNSFHGGVLAAGGSYVTTRTIPLPIGVTGDLFLLVKSDVNDVVFEHANEGNNVGFDTVATHINLSPPPDLEVTELEVPQSAEAGRPLTISYHFTNFGAGATPNSSWTDAFYLSTDTAFDPETDVRFGERTHFGALASDAGNDNSVTLTVPNGLSGNFFVLVATDSKHVVFENGQTANNLGASELPLSVLSHPADLVVTATTPVSGEAGKTISVIWTVMNQGTGDTIVTDWVDKVFLSTDTELGNDLLLGAFPHQGVLDNGASYSRQEQIELPFSLVGNYRLFVVTDAPLNRDDDRIETGPSGLVFEDTHENNNTTSALSLAVTRNTPDLQVTTVTAPMTAATGGPLSVSWTVRNAGLGKTNVTAWFDDVYLSADTIAGDADDILIGSALHVGKLAPNGQYDVSRQFAVPQNMDGGLYHVLVRTDRPTGSLDTVNRVFETPNEGNNDRFAAVNTVVTLTTPVPDLAVTVVDAPAQAISGRDLTIGWTVQNLNAAATGDVAWFDTFYLSLDQVFDRNADLRLGYIEHLGGLGASQSYVQTVSFPIPGGVAGSYYVFINSDSRGHVFERGAEANNVNYDRSAVVISLPLPIDLVPGTITIPANAVPGQNFTIQYTVQNQSGNAATGDWFDSLYLSADDQIGASDVFLGRVRHTGGVAANGSYSESLAAPLPGLFPGDYHVIVRSDVRNHVRETNEANNFGASLTQTLINVPALTLGVAQTGNLLEGKSVFYKVTVAAGETLVITFDSAATTNTTNEIYASFGNMPSRTRSNFQSRNAFSADQEIVVPFTEAGTYYMLAYGADVGAVTSYSIIARTIPFSVQRVVPDHVGNADPVTLEIHGAKLDRGTTFRLVGPGGTVTASAVLPQDFSTTFAIFDLTGKTIGTYKLMATNSTNATVELSNAVTIVSGIGGRLEATLDVPEITFRGRTGVMYFNYANTGDADVIPPLVTIHSPTNTRMGLVPDDLHNARNLQFLAASSAGPAGILRPGQQLIIPVYFLADEVSGTSYEFEAQLLQADDPEAIDWQIVQDDYLTELTIARADFAAFFAQFQQQVGTTWGAFVSMLARNANLLPEVLGSPRDPFPLVDLETLRAIAFINTSLQGRLTSIDPQLELGGREVILAGGTLSLNTAVAVSLNDGSFIFNDLLPDAYDLWVDDAFVLNSDSIEIANGTRLSGQVFAVNKGVTLSGFLQAETSAAVPDATLVGIADDGTSYTGEVHADGSYVIRGLKPGRFDLIAEAPGRARTVLMDVEIGATPVIQNLTLQPESILRGTITLPPGTSLDSEISIALRPNGDQPSGYLHFVTLTTGNQFELRGIPSGIYTFVVNGPGYVRQFIQGLVVGTGETITEPITLARGAALRGVVTSSDLGFPVGAVQVALLQDGFIRGTTLPDEAGIFELTDVAPGDYTLRILEVIEGLTDEIPITVIVGEDQNSLSLTIRRGGMLTGIVTDSFTHLPLANTYVEVLLPNGEFVSRSTDATGRYTVQHLVPGSHLVTLSTHSTASTKTVEIPVQDGSTIETDLEAEVVARLQGRIVRGDVPLRGAFVHLFLGDQEVGLTVADADGRYQFYLVETGNYDLEIEYTGVGLSRIAGVEVASGQTVVRDLAAGSHSVQVLLDGPTEVIAGALVAISRETPNGTILVNAGRGDAQGQVQFDHLQPGTYLVSVLGDGDMGADESVTVPNGTLLSPVVRPVTLISQARVEGTLLDVLGTPVANAHVYLQQANSKLQSETQTSADGTYSLGNVTPGTYDIVAIRSGAPAFVQTGVTLSSGTTILNPTLSATSGTVTGVVKSSKTNTPIAGAAVTLVDSANHFLGMTTTDRNGQFQMTAASGTNLFLRVSVAGYLPAIVPNLSVTIGAFTNAGVVVLMPIFLGTVPVPPQELPSPSPRPRPVDSDPPLPPPPAVPKPDDHKDRKVTDADKPKKPDEKTKKTPPPTVEPTPTPAPTPAPTPKKKPKPDTHNDPDCPDECKHILELIYAKIDEINAEDAKLKVILDELNKLALDVAFTAARETADWLNKLREGLLPFRDPFGAQIGDGIDKIDDFLKLADDMGKVHDLETFKTALKDAKTAVGDVIGLVKSKGKLGTKGDKISPQDWFKGFQKLVDIAKGKTPPPFERGEQLKQKVEEIAQKANLKKIDIERLDRELDRLYDEYERCRKGHPECDDPPPPPHPNRKGPKGKGASGNAVDPNDIIGPQGFGDQHMLGTTSTLAYTIRFENQAAATLPAQEVVITQQLDAELDFRTFRLGEIGWGDFRYQPPANSAFVQVRVDRTAEQGFDVDVVAFIDTQTGVVTWTLTTIDPATGEKPVDGRLGFLPPNDDTHVGDGFVSYSVKAKRTVQTGDVIDAQARIVFDIEEPIDTPAIFNTIDATPPSSQMNPIQVDNATGNFLLSWSGGETSGSGLASFDVYVSDNGGAFEALLEETTLTEIPFVPELNHVYSFYTQARDNAGNFEAAPATPDVSTLGLDVSHVSLSISPAAVAEDGSGVLTFTFQRSGYTAVPRTVSFNVGGSATLGLDYQSSGAASFTATTGTVTFAAGATTATVTVDPTADTFLEFDDTVVLTLVADVGYDLVQGQGIGSGTITNDETVNIGLDDQGRLMIRDQAVRNDQLTVSFNATTQQVVIVDSANNLTKSIGTQVTPREVRVLLSSITGGALIADLGGGNDKLTLATFPAALLSVTLFGGAGNDSLTGGAGVETFFGGDGNDAIVGGAGDDVLIGGAGNDKLDGGLGSDFVDELADADFKLTNTALTGIGSDTLAGIERVRLTVGAIGRKLDASLFTAGTVTLTGGAGNDTLIGGSGADLLNGGSGNDLLTGGLGNDSIDGGAGIDRLIEAADVNFTLTNTALAGVGADVLSGIESVQLTGGKGNNSLNASGFTLGGVTLVGGDGNDTLTGTDSADVLDGGLGNDSILGLGGNDSLTGGAGNDLLNGGGDVGDVLVETANVNLTLTNAALAGLGTDVLIGIERAFLTGGAAANKFDASGFTLGAVTLVGLAGNDTLLGTNFADLLDGGLGNDSQSGGAGADTLLGGDGNDSMDGGADADVLNGQAGLDTLLGGAGDDTLTGELGNDSIIGGDGTDRLVEIGDVSFVLLAGQLTGLGTDVLATLETVSLTGGAGNNSLTVNGFAGNVTLHGAGGNDTLIGGGGNDLLAGDDGNDHLTGGAGSDQLDGGAGTDVLADGGSAAYTLSDSVLAGAGTDAVTSVELAQLTLSNVGGSINASSFTGRATLMGGTGSDTLSGGNGDDLLVGGDGADSLVGNGGDDTLTGGLANDSLNGGGGNDLLSESGDVSSLILGNFTLTGLGSDVLAEFERALLTGGASANTIDASAFTNGPVTLIGGLANDSLLGGSGADSLDGGLGNDTLKGNAAGDTLLGGDGDDSLAGGDGADSLNGQLGNDALLGGTGNDTLTGDAGNDLFDGGLDTDLLSEIVNVNLVLNVTQLTGLGTDTHTGIETAILIDGAAANKFDATLFGGVVTLIGAAGNDTLIGSANADSLDGGDGNDSLAGNSGADTVQGGAGNDTALAGDGNDQLFGGIGTDSLDGGVGNDLIDGGDGADKLFGQVGNDTLLGGLGADTLDGGADNDVLDGQADADSLIGGIGRDLLIGGMGLDTLAGGADEDILIGGTTSHSGNGSALAAIMAEWTSTNAYATRIANLLNGGGANGSTLLNATTAQNDSNAADKINGSLAAPNNTDLDWFFQSVNDVLDAINGEVRTTI